ncbi:MAG: lytic transglycosylase domain-containing protein [Pseudomonadota bacterium]
MVIATFSAAFGVDRAKADEVDALRPVVQALASNRGQAAYAAAQSISDATVRDLGLWLIARTKTDDLPIELRTAFRDAFAQWPGGSVITRQTESIIADAYGSRTPPLTITGTEAARTTEGQLMQAEALLQAGQRDEARSVASRLWRSDVLEDGLEARLLGSLGDLLSQDDHKFRAHWLLYRDRVTGAERLGQFLTAADRASITTRGRAIRDGGAALSTVRSALRSNPGDIHLAFELARLHRRADRPQDAANVLLQVRESGDALVRPDLWWRERHIVTRDLLEIGQPDAAYRLASAPTGSSASNEAQRAFLAGWIALRFLNDTQRAEPHFRQILEIGTTPITRARGYYWLGRTLSSRGDSTGANQAFAQAMTYGETFYGQAAATLANVSVRFGQVPNARRPQSAFFTYADLLYRLGRRVDARIFLYDMARESTNPAEVVAMADLAERHGDATSVVQIGKLGARNHRSLALLGYPTGAFPQNAQIPERLPQAVAYAIARQESGFDAAARSRAGALGLMQLMPETARRIASDVGVSHSTGRLTSDPAHNVTLGAYHLDELLADYDGSYILTFIAYNAGPGRVPQWIERFGDPRGGTVDVLDWIEIIPFSETRSYVQRVLENIFVYQHITANG